MAAALGCRAISYRIAPDFTGWIEVPGRGEHRLALGALKKSGSRPRHAAARQASSRRRSKRRSSAFCSAFLRGLFDADGSVQGDQAKGVSIRLAQSDLRHACRRCSACCSGSASLARSIASAGPPVDVLPDGQRRQQGLRDAGAARVGRSRATTSRAYAERIGFADGDKAARSGPFWPAIGANSIASDSSRRFATSTETARPRSSTLRFPA